jgi:DNA-directed RNA polymerase subunit RPC12/RpoP
MAIVALDSFLSASLSEIEAKKASEGTRWEMFESFLGFIRSSSFEEAEKFVNLIPHFLSEAKQGKYSPESLRNMILRNLTRDTLQLLQCTSCDARFVVDKPPKSYKGYQCPICGLSYQVKVDQEGLAILKAALATPKPQIVVVQSVTQQTKKPTPKDKDNG